MGIYAFNAKFATKSVSHGLHILPYTMDYKVLEALVFSFTSYFSGL
jgi:hypothetical protein